MDEPFILTVNYKGVQRDFETVLIMSGYTYKFRTMVNEVEMFFERDDAGEFRALAPDAEAKALHSLDAGLLQAIAQELEQILS